MLLKNAKIVSPADNLNDIFDIRIENGKVVAIEKNLQDDGIDLTGEIIVPGLIDMHCHLREPGFEYKETIESGTKSAVSGGFVAVCPMANTSPVVDCVEVLESELVRIKRSAHNNVFPICAVSKGLESNEITDIKALKQAGAIAFSDDGKPFKNKEILKKALQTGELIISHEEDEADTVERELNILKDVGGRLHFAHISTKKSVELIREAKLRGIKVTCETAPHYFLLNKADETKDGRFKMNPPLRSAEDVKEIIKGLQDGTVDCIATDHAPHSIEEKMKNFDEAPFGIVGFETALGAGLKLVFDGYLTLNQLVEKMSVNPATILGLSEFGHIRIGESANLTVILPDYFYQVNEKEFVSKCKISPFNGMTFQGSSMAVVVNGKIIN